MVGSCTAPILLSPKSCSIRFEILAEDPDLGAGPADEGWLLGTHTSRLLAGKRPFARGERYRDFPPAILAEIPNALAAYAARPADAERPGPKELQIIDAAQRVAGTGSLGALRIAVFAHGKGAPEGHWPFEMRRSTRFG
jgi:Uncharacterized protein conserved in bacteria (DUF2252)